MNKCLCVALVSIFATSALAERLSPSPQDVIATWQVTPQQSLSASQANELLDKSQQIESSANLLPRVEQDLKEKSENGELTEEFIYIKARLLQRNHEFDKAASLLSPLENPNARLLLATVYINLGQFDNAIAACKSLTGKVEYAIMLTCLLDAQYQQAPSAEIYHQLASIMTLPQMEKNTEYTQWGQETLAAMALDLGKPQEAIAHLKQRSGQLNTVSALAIWADALLQLNQPEKVLSELGQRIKNPHALDDSLLLALAKASQKTSTQAQWQTLAEQRIEQRTWRKDWSHAAYIADYYLSLKADAPKAKHFAELNWQYAKGLADRRLLEQANQKAKSSS